MSRTTQSHLVTTENESGLRPTVDELRENNQLLIRLRWAAGLGTLAATIIARVVLDIELQTAPLVLIGLVVLFYNSVLRTLTHQEKRTSTDLQRLAWVQIVLDWGATLALVHFTGGITSPAIFYFVIHASLSGTILLPWQTRSLSVFAIVILAGLAWSERNGWLPHIDVPQFSMGDELYKDANYFVAVMFFFGTTLIALSELVMHKAQLLRQREERIRQLYDARSTFLRVATHELRAPLAAGLSLMHNIEAGYAGDFNEQQQTILKRVTSRLEGLRTLIDDLLTLASSQEVSASGVPLERVSMRDVLIKMIERETPNANAKHIEMTCHLDEDAGYIMAGDVGLAIIIGNLLNNAIKYTPEEGDVMVEYSVSRSAHRASLIVKDTGMGIPADELPNIFNEFFRARNAKAAQINGTGIGLSTVRTLVERYQGKITLESEEGEGTTVQVSFALAPR